MASECFQKKSLGDIADFRNGKAISPERYSDAGRHPVFGSNGQIGRSNEVLNPEPVVAIGRVGAYCGSVYYIREPSWVTDNAIVTLAKPGNDLRFLYYLLRHLELRRTAIGSAQPLMTQGGLKVVKTTIPPLPEQKAIAHILGTLDDKIEVNRRMNETLEGMARALFTSWFVDFDPVLDNALAAGNPIPEAFRDRAAQRADAATSAASQGRRSLPNPLAAQFPNAFHDSDLGPIPEGWEQVGLGEIADVNWGDTNVTKKSYVETGFTAYSAKGPDGFLSYHDYDRVGVVVSAIGANSGYTWLARGKWSCIKNTIRFWSTDPNIPTEYLFLATHGKGIWPLRGSAQPFISQTDARKLAVLLPSNKPASVFGTIVSPLFDKTEASKAESHTLAALRDTLLPKLLSGELRVNDAEKFVERCV